MQEFVDEHDALTVEEWNALDPPPNVDEAQNESIAIAQAAVDRGCFPGTMEEWIADGIDNLEGENEVGRSIAAALRGDGPFMGPPAPVVETTAPRNAVPVIATLEPGESLPDLLDRLAPGSTVRFAAGFHRFSEPIVIDFDLTFEGAGADLTTLSSSADGAALAFVGPGGFEMRDLTLEHTGASEASVFLAIEGPVTIEDAIVRGGVEGASAEGGGHGIVFAFENLPGFPERQEAERAGALSVVRTTVTGNDAAGVLVSGSASPQLTDIAVVGNGGCGVCFTGRSTGVLQAGNILENEIGLQVGDEANVRSTATRFAQNVAAAVSTDANTRTELSEVAIEENGNIGVQAAGRSVVSIRSSTVRLHGVGVLSAGESDVRIVETGIVDHDIGVQAGGDATTAVSDSVVWLSSVAALSYGDDSRNTAVNNEIDQATDVGIQIGDRSTADLFRNVIEPGAGAGISYIAESSGTAAENSLRGRDVGIQVGGTAAPQLRDNSVLDSIAVGVLFGDDSTGSAEGNEISGANSVGLLVGGRSTPSVTANRLVRNGVGLVFRESAGGTARGNTIDEHVVAIQIVDEAVPVIRDNTITNSLEAGAVFQGAAGGRMFRNSFVGNGNVALQVGERSTPSISENEFEGPGVYGVIYRDEGGGEFRANELSNFVYGVQLNDSAVPQLYDNTFLEVALTNMAYGDSSGGENSGNTCTESFSAGISVTPPANPNLGANDCTVSVG